MIHKLKLERERERENGRGKGRGKGRGENFLSRKEKKTAGLKMMN